MDRLRKVINELSEEVDERIAEFTWREALRPRNWRLVISLKLQVFLNRRYGLDRMVEQANRARWFHWFNPFTWSWLLPTSLYLLATRHDTSSRRRSRLS